MEACPETRQYYAIWAKLKELPRPHASTFGVSISAPRALHKRIIKAVKKEKWMDLGFKISQEPRTVTLSHTRNASILTFYLTYTLTPEDF